jgi:hypothetical protein
LRQAEEPFTAKKKNRFWLGPWFENGNITENKLCTVTGNKPQILVEQFDRANGLFRNESLCSKFSSYN